MLTWHDFPRIDDPLLGIVFYLEKRLFLGKEKTKIWLSNLVLKMNIGAMTFFICELGWVK